jgi:glycerophosphoryl diester phosphodiesterase
VVTSFRLAEIDAIRRALPHIPVGPVLSRLGPAEMARLKGRGYNAVSLAARAFSRRALEFCRGEGLSLLLWVVNRPQRVLDFARKGVDGVFTDCPGPVVEALRAQGLCRGSCER